MPKIKCAHCSQWLNKSLPSAYLNNDFIIFSYLLPLYSPTLATWFGGSEAQTRRTHRTWLLAFCRMSKRYGFFLNKICECVAHNMWHEKISINNNAETCCAYSFINKASANEKEKCVSKIWNDLYIGAAVAAAAEAVDSYASRVQMDQAECTALTLNALFYFHIMCMDWSGVAGKNGNILCMRTQSSSS